MIIDMATVQISVEEFPSEGCGGKSGPDQKQYRTQFDKEDIRDSFLELSNDEKYVFQVF